MYFLVFLTVWPYGAVSPRWQAIAFLSITILAALWMAHSLITGKALFRFDWVTICLAGLVLQSVIQLIPLPLEVVRIVSPARASTYELLQPPIHETLPGEARQERPGWITLSVHPYATSLFLFRVGGLLLLYLVVRNWLATRESLKRFCWLAVVTGGVMATVALGANLSSPSYMIYWNIQVDGTPFGPFINRNHYPDYIAFCFGWGIALILALQQTAESEQQANRQKTLYAPGPLEFLMQPAALLVVLSLGIMSISLIFSRSRGGLLAYALAFLGFLMLYKRSESGTRRIRLLMIPLLVFVLAGIAWFGTRSLEERLSSAVDTRQNDERLTLWKRSLAQVPGYWLFGSGQRSFDQVETINRPYTESQLYFRYEHAHNEYVEAILEGGIIRFGFTLALAVGLLWSLGKAYRHRANRTIGPYIIGCWFALLVVAAHAMTDFALHMPAVAIIAVVSLAFGNAAAHDPEFAMVKRRSRRRSTSVHSPRKDPESIDPGDAAMESKPTVESGDNPHPHHKPPLILQGLGLRVFGGIALLASILLLVQSFAFFQAQKYLDAAIRLTAVHDRSEQVIRLELLDAAQSWQPNNPIIQFQYGTTWINIALQERPPAAEAVAGPVLPDQIPLAHRLPEEVVRERVFPGLRALRRSRDLCPNLVETQVRLGFVRQYFEQSEPAIAYFERARFLMPGDPNIWYACGTEEFQGRNFDKAMESWRRSLEISPIQLRQILLQARTRWTPTEIIARILPATPEIHLESIPHITEGEPAESPTRRELLSMAARYSDSDQWPWRQWAAIAKANEQLDRMDRANKAWINALSEAPNQVELRIELADYYERNELYAEAAVQLKWLIDKYPANTAYRERLKAAEHGARLHRVIRRE